LRRLQLEALSLVEAQLASHKTAAWCKIEKGMQNRKVKAVNRKRKTVIEFENPE